MSSQATLPAPLRAALSNRIDAGSLDLPVLPEVAAQVLSLSQSDGDLAELTEVVARDQSLAAHLLEVSNSAAFAPVEPIVSLQQAVARLGLSTLKEITVAVVVKNTTFQLPGFERLLDELWGHSAAAAAYAKEIARRLRQNVESAFLCGLLHDVGKPVTLDVLARICREGDLELDEDVARVAMDAFHADVGGLIVREWKLPAWVEAAAEGHHDPSRAETARTEVLVTALADELAHWTLGTREVDEDALLGHPVCVELDLYEEDVRSIMDARDRVAETVEAFR